MKHLEKAKVSTSAKLSVQKLFNKPPKFSFSILKTLLTVLIPLLVNTPDIYLNIYIITIVS